MKQILEIIYYFATPKVGVDKKIPSSLKTGRPYAFNSPLTWRDPSGLAPEKGPKEGELQSWVMESHISNSENVKTFIYVYSDLTQSVTYNWSLYDESGNWMWGMDYDVHTRYIGKDFLRSFNESMFDGNNFWPNRYDNPFSAEFGGGGDPTRISYNSYQRQPGIAGSPGGGSRDATNINYTGKKVNSNDTGIIGSFISSNAVESYLDVTQKFDNTLQDTKEFFEQLLEENIEYYSMMLINGFEGDVIIDYLSNFFENVKTNAPFDIKQPGKGYSPEELGGEYAYYNGQPFRFDDFGNYNFGVAARAYGLPLIFAVGGAGLYQTFWSRTPDFTNPFGFFDHMRDTQMIIMGYYHVFK